MVVVSWTAHTYIDMRDRAAVVVEIVWYKSFPLVDRLSFRRYHRTW